MAYPPTPVQPSSITRVSDAEREDIVQSLTTHVASGRLSIDEFDVRAGRAYAAVTQADLHQVLSDLPTTPPVATQNDSPARREWRVWAAVGILCLSIWAVTSIATGNFLYPWPVWVIGPWGAMLALQHVGGGHAAMRCPSRRYAD